MATPGPPVGGTSPNKAQTNMASNSIAGAQPTAPAQQTPKELNYATLCRVGQEYVHEIVQKTTELFNALKTLQLPSNDAATQQFNDRKAKVDDMTKFIAIKFKYLHAIYDKLQQQSIEFGDLVDVDHMVIVTDKRYAEPQKHTNEEQRLLVEQLHVKNRQLKEIIDKLRTVVWEINTMMAMKKTVD